MIFLYVTSALSAWSHDQKQIRNGCRPKSWPGLLSPEKAPAPGSPAGDERHPGRLQWPLSAPLPH